MLNSHRLTRDGTVAFFAAFKSMGAMLPGPVDFLTFSCFNFSRPELCAILNSFSCGGWRCCISGRFHRPPIWLDKELFLNPPRIQQH